MADGEGRDAHGVVGPDLTRCNLDVAHVQRRLAAAQHHVHQVAHAVQGPAPAENGELGDRFPTGERRHQPAQPEDVIQVAMRQQHLIQALETQPAAQ
jgi:hypothetical protein